MSSSLPGPLKRRTLATGSLLVAGALLAACSSTSSTSTAASGTSAAATSGAAAAAAATTGAAAATSGAAAAAGDCSAYSAYGTSNKGKTVTMFGSILSPESDSLATSWAGFEKCTGITIQYTGNNDFESQLPVRVKGGNAPDLAIIPQPGLIASMVATGKAVPAPAAVEANVTKYWSPIWKSYATVNGKFYGAPQSANDKSFVWYSPKAFTKAGYAIPTTWAGLMALSAKIAATNVTPWCGGISSGTATGWPATDWLEELVLRNSGPTVYDNWVSHKVKFDSPEITAAMTLLQNWMRKPGFVLGGDKTVATTTFQNAGLPILTGKCFMLQQAGFYGAQWPKGTDISPTGDIYAFYMPVISTSYGQPVEGGGEFTVAFSSEPAVQEVQTYLSSADWATSRVKVASGWVSANNGVPLSAYTDPIDKLSAQALTDPKTTFRFDASDQMPSAVGVGC